MTKIFTHQETGLPAIDQAGEPRVLACLPPRAHSGLPDYSSRFETLPRSEWKAKTWEEAIEWVVRILDQDGQGSCAGHMGAAILEMDRAVQGANHIDLSPCCIYGQVNGGRDRGAIISDILKVIQQTGTCTEATVGAKNIYQRNWDSKWREEAPRFKGFGYECKSFDQLASAILRMNSVGFGIMVGNNFGDLDSEGFAPLPRGGGGGHAMAGAPGGLVQHSRTGEWGILTVNSWSRRWGRDGLCVVGESHFERWADSFAFISAVEDPQEKNVLPNAKL